MKELKVLRRLMKAESATIVADRLHLDKEESKWFEIGFNSAKSIIEDMLCLLEEE